MSISNRWRNMLLVAIVGGSAAAAENVAEACHAHSSGHYYAILWNTDVGGNDAEHGAAVNIDTTTLTSDSSNFVNHEFWYGVVAGAKYWVEVGVKDGLTFAGSTVNQHIFWADNRNGGGYHEHYPAVSWKLDAFYQNKIVWSGRSCAWDVYFGDILLGTSTNQCAGTDRYVAAGIEATTPGSNERDGGYLESWQRKDSSNTWHAGWAGATGDADCPADINVSSSSTEEVLHGPI